MTLVSSAIGGWQLNEEKTSWTRTAVVGAGAVGCYFGGMLARAGAPVVLIGRAGLADAVRENGLFLDTLTFQERVNVESSTEISAAQSAELVLFCVKTLDTETAARQLAPYLRAGANVVSLQNGVNNVERIRAAAGIDALPAAVYVAAAMAPPGGGTHFRCGGLGDGAGNAISALARVNYGQIAASEEARPLLEAVVGETLAVARANGVYMQMLDNPKAAIDGALVLLAKQMGPATSSTAQDLARGKRTEIDALNGYVARLGAQLGVATPVNYTLFSLVKLAEMNLTPSKS